MAIDDTSIGRVGSGEPIGGDHEPVAPSPSPKPAKRPSAKRKRMSRLQQRTLPMDLAIRGVNRDALRDAMYQHIYGRVVTYHEQNVLRWLVGFISLRGRMPDQTVLAGMVIAAGDLKGKNKKNAEGVNVKEVSMSAARNYIRSAAENGLIKQWGDGSLKLYDLSEEQEGSYRRLLTLLDKIDAIVLAQLADQTNPLAGRDLLDVEDYPAYTNIVSQK